MQKITPNLWFDGNAQEAVDFYVSVFPNSKVTGGSSYPERVEDGLADFQVSLAGKPLTIEFELNGLAFTAINAGPEFSINHTISFMVNFDPSRDNNALQNLDTMWEQLLDGGKVLMPLDKYPYSERYGWVKDKYGLTWQLILTDPDGEERPFIIPNIMFGGPVQNKAREAMEYYVSVFEDSKAGLVAPYPEDTGPALKDVSIMFADLQLAGQWFAVMDSGVEQEETFNEAVSLAVFCKDQAEIDYFWEKLSTVPEAEQCGWCKDQFGLSWQIVPENMEELMQRPGAYAKMMQMHKLEIDKF